MMPQIVVREIKAFKVINAFDSNPVNFQFDRTGVVQGVQFRDPRRQINGALPWQQTVLFDNGRVDSI